jgi:hypothetical protein
MSKVRNISGGPLDVPLLDRVVEADETVEVPDVQPGHSEENPLPIVWPPDKWEAVADARTPKADTRTPKADDTSGKGM